MWFVSPSLGKTEVEQCTQHTFANVPPRWHTGAHFSSRHITLHPHNSVRRRSPVGGGAAKATSSANTSSA